MVHRDLKPENVLVGGSNRTLFLCDFGLTKVKFHTQQAPDYTLCLVRSGFHEYMRRPTGIRAEHQCGYDHQHGHCSLHGARTQVRKIVLLIRPSVRISTY